ncbi:MAG: hypothetical protein ICV66_06125 [Chitinophagaceae bacterium]|nr:hypothetical protein [Chitinophagaceae bacterium]
MPGQKNIALICNSQAGYGFALQVADRVSVILRRKNVAHSIFTGYRPQVWDQFTDVWIVGGDGTLNYFINQYPEFKLPLSVFAGGTGNDFHWLLYGNLSIEQQIETVLRSTPQWIDAGMCNDKLFLNGVGVGFDGAVVKDLISKNKFGKSKYHLAVLKNIFSYKEKLIKIQAPNYNPSSYLGGEEEFFFMISIANGKRYGGSFYVAPKASITDGLLDISVVSKVPLLHRLKYIPVIEKGKHLSLPFIKYFQNETVQVTSKEPLHAHIDGEYLSSNSFKVKCLPRRFLFKW